MIIVYNEESNIFKDIMAFTLDLQLSFMIEENFEYEDAFLSSNRDLLRKMQLWAIRLGIELATSWI